MPLQHITNAEVIAAGVVSAPNVLNGTPQQNKTIFDNLVASVVVPAYNLCVDAVNALEVLGEHEREAEELREAAERLRDQAERGRVSAEELRAAAELLRERAEQARATAEGTRSNAESARVQAETARAAAETERRQHETARAEAETARGTAETQRRAAEQARERYVTELRQAVEAGEFDGHTPEKGVDYWTSADKQELAEEAAGFMPKEIFYAAYNTTTLAEIRDAYRAGKLCCCKYGGVACWLDGSSSLTEEAFFAGIADGGGSGKAKILCISMADVEGSSAWMNWTVDISTDREKVFRAEVFETSYDELMTAYRAGKLCVCRYLNRDYILQDMPGGYMGHATFFAPMDDGIKMLYLWAGTRDWEPVDIPYPGGGGGESNVLIVDYNVTPFDDIAAAIEDGKLCIMYYGNRLYTAIYRFSSSIMNQINFYSNSTGGAESAILVLKSGYSPETMTTTWTEPIDASLILKSAISKEISADSTDSQVASAKAVYDHHDSTKQDTLTAGDNITIEGNVISATGGGGGGAVDSVNGKTGKVVLKASDVGAVAFDDSYIPDANTFYSVNGYAKTSTSTANLPSVCTGSDRWGVIFFIAENAAAHTGTQMFFPIDGEHKGRIFYRSMVRGVPADWNLIPLTGGGGDTEEFTNAEVDAIWNEVMA